MLVDTWVESVASGLFRDPSGHCLSWTNPSHPGYPYPEITGLLASLLARWPVDQSRGRELHDVLCDKAEAEGVRRGDIGYTFDTAMALRGVIEQRRLMSCHEFGRREAVAPEADPVPHWRDRLLRAVETRTATTPAESLSPNTRWSLSFGAHQAKISAALIAALRVGVSGGPDAVGRTRAALNQLEERTLGLQATDGRFRIHAASPLTYAHAHCYAVEGLLMMSELGDGSAGCDDARTDAVERAVAWLASVQAEDGSVQAWHDGAQASGPVRTDATAQTVRLFRLLDSGGYADEVDRGQAFLRQVSSSHGVPYEPGSADLASWSTIFAIQALAPDGHRACPTRATDFV